MTPVRTVTIALACALAAGVAGLWFGGHPEKLPRGLRNAFVSDDRAIRAELIDAIDDNFYKPLDRSKLENASLKGIVDSLHDRYSHYITPAEADRFRESVSGKFDGVGMGVEQDRRGLRVLNVFERSPARRAGIHPGDLITSVNGRSIAGVSSTVATARIKGRPGTRVRLQVLTPRPKRVRRVTLRRQRITVPIARSRLVRRGGRRLGVVQLFGFSEGAHGVLAKHVRSLLRRGARGIVLDLRGNGGGLLTEAVLVSSVFVANGEIVSVRGRSRPERKEMAEGSPVAPRLPLVVLVDKGSASASEIVTGALRDRHRATVVGTHTFGKGLVQEVETLSNHGLLDLTVANYYLPNGETIGKGGIKPQVRARDKPRTRRDEALPVALDVLLRRSR
ncbi:MAG: S41 family peptidase [Thermoleophilaceae bacterium]